MNHIMATWRHGWGDIDWRTRVTRTRNTCPCRGCRADRVLRQEIKGAASGPLIFPLLDYPHLDALLAALTRPA